MKNKTENRERTLTIHFIRPTNLIQNPKGHLQERKIQGNIYYKYSGKVLLKLFIE